MRPAFRPMRSRFIRLLASVLVVTSLLGNGLAMAKVMPVPVEKQGCAEMVGQNHHDDCCDDDGGPCPATNTDCDDQCMFRCQSTAVFSVALLVLPPIELAASEIAASPASERPPAILAPELRPPIFV